MIDSSILYRTTSVTTTHVEPSTGQDYLELPEMPEPRDYNYDRPETFVYVDWDSEKEAAIARMCQNADKARWESVMKAAAGFENEAKGGEGGGCDLSGVVEAINNNTVAVADKLEKIVEAISANDMDPIADDTINDLPDYEAEDDADKNE